MNINDIKTNYRIESVIGRHINLKKQGPELVGNCIFHSDDHASLKVNASKQIFQCFACGTGGDIFDFFTKQGMSVAEAKNAITDGAVLSTPVYEVKEPDYVWENIICSQDSLPNPLNFFYEKYNASPNSFWAYHDAQGNIISYACRFDLPEGKKDVLPCTYSLKKHPNGNTSGLGWNWRKHSKPHPLYNLHELHQRPEAIVLVVEGEKAADAAKRLFPQFVCVSWLGGKDNVRHADWSVLENRKVYLWADNDLPGVLAMFGGWEQNEKTGEYKRFKGVCEYVNATFKRIQNSPEFPKKWDIADADWTPEQAYEYLRNNRIEVPLVSEYPPNEIPEPAFVQLLPPPTIEDSVFMTPAPSIPVFTESEPETPENPYFRCLGFENNDTTNLYVFYVYRSNVIVKLSAGGITTANLMQLAPLNYWEGEYPKRQRSSGSVKFEINTVADHLITISLKIGIFNPSVIRGRGAWIDNGLPVIHCGDRLIVDGRDMQFSKHKSKYIYEAGQELGFELSEPLTYLEANKLVTILERLNWSRDINARLLAGWIVIAPLCGALSWRSHLWLTGPSGSGKSWIMVNILKKLMGSMFVDAQGATTEAGIRQYLKADALSVVFDEAESEDRKSIERMQAVLEIMRASSTSDGGKIIKGSSGGAATQFNIRSCFAFASIGSNLTQRSDISRISVLEIKEDKRPDKKERWKETQDLYYTTITDDYVKAFQSRAVKMLPIILKNAKTFSAAAAAELDNQRQGDQLGSLLAGAYSLYSDSLISYENAKKWIKERDWTEEKMSDSTKDEVKVLNRIMSTDTRIETSLGDRTRTIGELIAAANGNDRTKFESELITQERAYELLNRIGIKVENGHVLFSDQSQFIKKSLYYTAWANNYPTMLARISGAEKIDSVKFGSQVWSRAVKIPSFEIFGSPMGQEKLNI